MFARYWMAFLLLTVPLLSPLTACGSDVLIVKKPADWTSVKPYPAYPFLTAKDRMRWKSVLHWCDECDERAEPYLESNDGKNGGIFIYPIGDNQYIADIWCYTTMRQSEHLYYKVTEHNDTIESRLLILKQFFHTQYGGNTSIQENKNPKGEFVRFTDALAYGQTLFYPERPILPRLLIKKEFIGAGTCGLYTVYDISGDCPKVIEFRANLSCTPDAPSVDNWHLYPIAQTARWRIMPNPQRKDWKTPATPACSK
jgi:hypothetical protein